MNEGYVMALLSEAKHCPKVQGMRIALNIMGCKEGFVMQK